MSDSKITDPDYHPPPRDDERPLALYIGWTEEKEIKVNPRLVHNPSGHRCINITIITTSDVNILRLYFTTIPVHSPFKRCQSSQ